MSDEYQPTPEDIADAAILFSPRDSQAIWYYITIDGKEIPIPYELFVPLIQYVVVTELIEWRTAEPSTIFTFIEDRLCCIPSMSDYLELTDDDMRLLCTGNFKYPYIKQAYNVFFHPAMLEQMDDPEDDDTLDTIEAIKHILFSDNQNTNEESETNDTLPVIDVIGHTRVYLKNAFGDRFNGGEYTSITNAARTLLLLQHIHNKYKTLTTDELAKLTFRYCITGRMLDRILGAGGKDYFHGIIGSPGKYVPYKHREKTLLNASRLLGVRITNK